MFILAPPNFSFLTSFMLFVIFLSRIYEKKCIRMAHFISPAIPFRNILRIGLAVMNLWFGFGKEREVEIQGKVVVGSYVGVNGKDKKKPRKNKRES